MFPNGFERRMRALLGAEYDDFAASYDRPRNVGLRLNPLKHGSADLSRFHLYPVPWAAGGFYYDAATRPGLSPCHEAGLYYLQEPSAMAPAELLDVRAGQRILDLCAAPGGKTTQIAAKMAGTGLLVCNEINPKRAKILARNIERCCVANALVLNEHPRALAARFPEYFDRILVDAPCSGEGMFRKEDAAVTDWSEDTVLMCAGRQYEILCTAAEMLRGGGRLVYSTCTFSPQENEGVISKFLREHAEFSLAEVSAPHFATGRPEWGDPQDETLSRAVRLWPHLLRGEGHFAAVLTKSSGGTQECDTEPAAALPAELTEFCTAAGVTMPEGQPLLFGERVFLAPEGLPALRGLTVLRAGLELGERRKNRFEPAHAWALWLPTAGQTADFPVDSGEIAAYLRGETLPASHSGWTLVRAENLSLGWGKASGGVIKNHFPKGLRHLPQNAG